jgi:hypothetical protein
MEEGKSIGEISRSDKIAKGSLVLILHGIYFTVLSFAILSLVFIGFMGFGFFIKIGYSIFVLIFLGVLYYKIKLDRKEINQLFGNI